LLEHVREQRGDPGDDRFEVGAEVRAAFTDHDIGAAACFKARPGVEGKYLMDIFALARRRLARVGVTQVYGGGVCTVTEAASFFSYRRDGGRTGRMAALIWMDRSAERA